MPRRTWEARRLPPRRAGRLLTFVFCGALLTLLFLALQTSSLYLNRPVSDGRTLFAKAGRQRVDKAEGLSKFSESSYRARLNITEEMLDPRSPTRQLNEQISLAKAYEIMAKDTNNLTLAWQLDNEVRRAQLLLSQASIRGSAVSSVEAEPVIRTMSILFYRARELHFDSAVQLVKLRGLVAQQEERASQAAVQATFYSQLAAEAVPKGLHCLAMTLTAQWASRVQQARLEEDSDKVQVQVAAWEDPTLHHFCVVSDNVLAVGVVVTSAVRHALRPERMVFHILTDSVTYGAMRMWFALHPPSGATVEIRTTESMAWLNATYAPVLRQLQDPTIQSYYFKVSMQEPKNTVKFHNPKYLSIMNHLRFYLPEIFPRLEKVVFLDDDVVVQKDLAPLFAIDMQGNVNGAVETCLETFHRFHKYLNFSHPLIRDHFDSEACGWAYGMNLFDLAAWRHHNLTQVYHYWQNKNADRTLWQLGTLPAGLLTFYGLTLPLDRSWHVLGLGYDSNVDPHAIANGAVVHWNGNMKPWLKIAMSKYKPLWDEYVDFSESNLQRCHVH